MRLKNTVIPNDRGTPADFQEAANLASRYIAAEKVIRQRTARWWEVKNETTVASEWVLHAEPDVDSWGELAKFHNIMADTIHQNHSDVLVGGPTSAYMQLHVSDFGLAKKQLRFMDETKGHLDFYSHHFYESRILVLNEGERHAGGYLGGRLEGVLDLLRNHMMLTDNVKPMLVTETGTLCSPDSELNTWITIKNLNSYLVRYMNRADMIDLISLWLLPVKYWAKTDKTLFNYDEDGKLIETPTELRYFLEHWEEYRGEQLPFRLETPDTSVHLHAVRDGSTVFVAINNLNSSRIAVDVNLFAKEARIVDIQQMRLFFDRGEMIRETKPRTNLKAVPVAVEETTLLKIMLDREPQVSETLVETTFFGDKVLQPTGRANQFAIRCPKKDLAQSVLRVCLSRDDGFEQPLKIRFNGQLLRDKIVVTPEKKKGNYWSYLNLEVPATAVQDNNDIIVEMPQSGGYITSVALVNAYRQE